MNTGFPGRKYHENFDDVDSEYQDEFYEDMMEEIEGNFELNQDELFEHDMDRFLSGEADQDILSVKLDEDLD